MLHLSTFLLLVAPALIAVLSAVAGVSLTGLPASHRKVVPFSAGLLIGIALFGVWPELAGQFGWGGGLALLAAGFALLWVINRYVYPVCPTCAPTHHHESCGVTLHGFAVPLIAAGTIHSLLDGWGIAASQQEGSRGLGLAVFLGVSLHKIPAGLAYGAILRAALRSRTAAVGWCAISQAATPLGGAMEFWLTPHLGAHWIGFPLAIAGGSFFYLGFHAVHNEWQSRGVMPAFAPALTGAAGAAALQQGLRVLLR